MSSRIRHYFWEGLDPAKLTVIAPSIDAFSPKNHAMAFTSVIAVLRAAGLAADRRHHYPRAVFERLDGTVGRVESKARLVEEAQLLARRPAARAGLTLGSPEGPAGRARRRSPSTCTPTRTSRTCCWRAPT